MDDVKIKRIPPLTVSQRNLLLMEFAGLGAVEATYMTREELEKLYPPPSQSHSEE